MTRAELDAMTGAEQLRRCAQSMGFWRWFGGAYDWGKYSAEELLAIWRAVCLCEWDACPDQWTEAQIAGALRGFTPEFYWDDEQGMLPRALPLLADYEPEGDEFGPVPRWELVR